MAIKKLKPNTPKRRHATYDNFSDLTKKKAPEKKLMVIKKKKSGRNNQGKITVRHRGGGTRKYFRLIDLKRDKFDIPAVVESIEYDPNRGARIALLCYLDGEKRYIIAPVGLKEGEQIVSSKELVEIKLRYLNHDPSLTVEQLSRIKTVVPYNLDAWDGYAVERETLYGTLQYLNKKVVVLAGDTHNAWASDLHDLTGQFVGVELATSSVSSPGMEKYLSIPMQQLQEFEFAFTTLIDDLSYCNLNQRGYLKVRFTAEQVQADWVFVDSIKHKEYIVDETRSHQVILDSTLLPVSALKQTA